MLCKFLDLAMKEIKNFFYFMKKSPADTEKKNKGSLNEKVFRAFLNTEGHFSFIGHDDRKNYGKNLLSQESCFFFVCLSRWNVSRFFLFIFKLFSSQVDA